MKTNAITLSSGAYNRELEETIEKKDKALKDQARKNAKHFAQRNLPAPVGDHLSTYAGGLKSGYEELTAHIYQEVQPATHYPEAKMDYTLAKEKEKQFNEEIDKTDEQIRNDEYELDNYQPGSIPLRMWVVGIATSIIGIGEVAFNTKAFQVTGENMLFALILSISISFAVFVFSHVAPFLLKSVKTAMQKRLVFWGSLLLVFFVFVTLAIFRSQYLATHEVKVSPFHFVIINFFFFFVSALLSYFILPSWAEIKENLVHLKLYYAVQQNKKKAGKLRREKEALKENESEKNKQRIRLAHYAAYSVERVKKLYKESVEIFKSANLAYRTDRQVPDCFGEEIPEMDVNNPVVFYEPVNEKDK